jgi:Outer membrane protein beta-barrel domain
MSRFLLVLFFALSFPFCMVSYAQSGDDCELLLNQASEELSAGHFTGIDSLLMPCIKGGFTREQRQRAYLLLTQVYLLLDEPEHAESSYLEVLRANPEFVADPTRDPIDVVYLSKKFTAAPIFSIFGRLGGNTTFVNVLKELSITGEPIDSKYVFLPGWTVAAGGNWNINERISLSTELQYAFTAYRREQFGLWSTSDTKLQDRLNWFNVPVAVVYNFRTGKVVPYAYGGLEISYLVSSQANPTLNDRPSATAESVTPSESPIENYSFKRKSWNRSIVLGGGLRYKWGLHYLFGDMRYTLGLKRVDDYAVYDNSKASGYEDYTTPGLVASGEDQVRYASSSSIFKLNHLFITIGYMHQLYNPRKLKKARTKGVLRNILKGKDAQ